MAAEREREGGMCHETNIEGDQYTWYDQVRIMTFNTEFCPPVMRIIKRNTDSQEKLDSMTPTGVSGLGEVTQSGSGTAGLGILKETRLRTKTTNDMSWQLVNDELRKSG